MEAGAAALGNVNDVTRGRGLIDRRQRHSLGGHREQAEAQRKRGSSKNLHRVSFPLVICRDAAESGLRKQYSSPATPRGALSASGGDANADAGDGAASPNAGDASDGANDGASGHDDANAPAPA
jgi:hypothetical protein